MQTSRPRIPGTAADLKFLGPQVACSARHGRRIAQQRSTARTCDSMRSKTQSDCTPHPTLRPERTHHRLRGGDPQSCRGDGGRHRDGIVPPLDDVSARVQGFRLHDEARLRGSRNKQSISQGFRKRTKSKYARTRLERSLFRAQGLDRDGDHGRRRQGSAGQGRRAHQRDHGPFHFSMLLAKSGGGKARRMTKPLNRIKSFWAQAAASSRLRRAGFMARW